MDAQFGGAVGDDVAMTVTRAGRPRLTSQRRPGTTARDEILDAAGELFTTTGYTGTSTRTIAEAVGIRQASLYHYFKTKDDILCALLSQTVTPTLAFIPNLETADPALSARGTPPCAGGIRRQATARRSLESWRALPAAGASGAPGSSRSGRTAND